MHSEKCLIFQMGRYGCNWLNPNTLLCIFVLKIQNGAYTFTSHPSKKKNPIMKIRQTIIIRRNAAQIMRNP